MADDRDLRLDDEDPELGPPIEELRELRDSAPRRFAHRVRGRIVDRMFAADVLDFSMPVFARTLLEYLSMIFAVFSSNKSKESEDS